MSKMSLRNRLFTLYSKNLSDFLKVNKFKLAIEQDGEKVFFRSGIYICPLCLKGFSEESLNQKLNNPLTIEDIPPKSVGTKVKILTCKLCNNKSGSKLDRALTDTLKAETFILGIENNSIAANAIIDGKAMKVDASIDRKIDFTFNIKTQNTSFARKQQEFFFNNYNTSELKLTFQVPKADKIKLALLRVGLLMMFQKFGNRLLFENNYKRILQDINSFKITTDINDSVISIPDSLGLDTGISILVHPKEYKAFFITFPIGNNNYSRRIGILFPGPGEEGWNKYIMLQKNIYNSSIKYNFAELSKVSFIENENFVNAYDLCCML